MLAQAWAPGRADVAEAFADLFELLPAAERLPLAPLLEGMAAAGSAIASATWSRCFPALARIGGDQATEIRAFVYQHAASDVPVRLAGTCVATQELVARALHAASGRSTFFGEREFQAPGPQVRDLESTFAERPFGTLLLAGQSCSHYERLLDRLLDFCAANGVRAVLGIDSDAWDATEFEPFDRGPELAVNPIPLAPLPGAEALGLLTALLAEGGMQERLGIELVEQLAGWTHRDLFSVARRCHLSTARREPLLDAVREALDLVPRYGM